ncbi:MAG: hypothetical protein LJE70_07930 [Chromatiaceae bacterium]|jgi:hypothetical protein|nr:hypothetical protein [Chromatiaceae bacterium]
MLGKILLTAAVILGAYLVIRARMQLGREQTTAAPIRAAAPLVPPAVLRATAYGLAIAMIAGSLLWLYLDYAAGREVVTVRIINANTGDVTTYEARRSDVKDRRFTTLDGRPITLANVDRMELSSRP